MSEKFLPEEKQAVIDSLEKTKYDTNSINTKLTGQNTELQNKWNKETYEGHKYRFENGYYDVWKANEDQEYKNEIAKIEKIKVEGTLKGEFTKQEQPGDRFWWKSRRNESKAISRYKTQYGEDRVKFSKNTVREMAALDKYKAYHDDYFDSRRNQKRIYDDYKKNGVDGNIINKWGNNIKKQSQKFGKFFGSITGSLTTIASSVVNGIYSKDEENKQLSRKNELDVGLRPFFAMTKKTLLWKKQVGLLGTETKEERDDGSEYNKKLLRVYTKGTAADRVGLMDNLAKKLLSFKLTPNMFTNRYLAKNKLQMQRYTDMLTAFVELTKYNPDYLDVTTEGANHTSPDMAALVRSRIILMQPIMSDFMEKHARYNGFRREKNKGVLANHTIDGKPSDFANDEQYEAFVKKTWEMVKAANASTTEFFDDKADLLMKTHLENEQTLAITNREKRKAENKNLGEKDDDEFTVKYDVTGESEKKLRDIKEKISSNPYVYELFGPDLDQIYKKINEMVRRLDEMSTRASYLGTLENDAQNVKFADIEGYSDMWAAYVQKEKARVSSEVVILKKQIKNYESAVDYFVKQDLKNKEFDFKLEPPKDVQNVLTYEGLNHVLDIEKCVKYNAMLYKAIGFYDFEKIDPQNAEELQSQYNFTILKRGMERARYVNKMQDGQNRIEITDSTKLNNIEKRKICEEKYNNALQKENDYKLPLKEICNTDIEKLINEYKLSEEIDVTKDESFVKYFKVKSIADIGKELEKDPTGKTIPGFDSLKMREQDELRIRASLFKDYFNRWEGQMEYTLSEAYDYLGDMADMKGNNAIVDGVKKRYTKSTFEELNKIFGKEVDNNNSAMAVQMAKFIHGMAKANDYSAKEIKLFGKDAYVSYKAKYDAEKLRKDVTTTYEEDYEALVRAKALKNTKKEKDKYLARVDTGIALIGKCEKYYNNQKESNNRLSFDSKWSDKQKGEYLQANYNKAITIIQNFNEKYISEDYLLENMDQVLKEVNFCDDFFSFLRRDQENWRRLEKAANISAKGAQDMERYESIAFTMSNLVNTTLVDYGITNISENTHTYTRSACKRQLVSQEPKYAQEFKQAEIDFKISDADLQKRLEELDKQISEVQKLRAEENAKNVELMEKDGAFEKLTPEQQAQYEFMDPAKRLTQAKKEEFAVKGANIQGNVVLLKRWDQTYAQFTGNLFVLKRKNKYDEQYQELLKQKEDLIMDNRNQWVDKMLGYNTRLADEKVKQEEEQLGGDYITKTLEEYRSNLKKMFNSKPLEKFRNYSEELFTYIEKNFGDADITDPEAVKNALAKTGKAWFFQLSAGARREALTRLTEYEKNPEAMNDYFVWKNNRMADELLIAQSIKYGQKDFTSKNIGTIRKIMNTIAEANASVNDIQTPEFMDRLKGELEFKGVDERQFMFLLRKHNRGISGLPNTKADADKAKLNKKDVDMYLDIGTKYEFLQALAEDVLKDREEMELQNINQQYILDNFEKCYFTANKMAAFQQLYYGEMSAFRIMMSTGTKKERELATKVKMYFDKGHGEEYALYYDTVMALANQYGVSADGSFNFGLTKEQIEKVQKNEIHKKEATELTDKNIKEAADSFGKSLNARWRSREMKETALAIDNYMDGTLANVELNRKAILDHSEKHDHPEVYRELKNFYDEYDKALDGAWSFIKTIKQYEKDPGKVAFTKRGFDYPEAMFLMAKNTTLEKDWEKSDNIALATNFKNLFNRDTKNIAKNLSVVDEDKCKKVLARLEQMNLLKGSIGKDRNKKAIASDEYFKENFSADFFADMINAENYCMMFEMNDDFLNISGYDTQLSKADGMVPEYEERHKERMERLKSHQKELEMAREELKLLQDQVNNVREGMKEVDEKDVSQIGAYKDGLSATIKVLNDQKEKVKQYEKLIAKDREALERSRKSYKKIIEVVSPDKLKTLNELSKEFSNNENRFIISTYVDLFISYLAKNGIKADGTFVNSDIYDEVLRQRMVYKENHQKTGAYISKAEALQVGDVTTEKLGNDLNDAYEKKLNHITGKGYLRELKELQAKEKKLNSEKKDKKNSKTKKQ